MNTNIIFVYVFTYKNVYLHKMNVITYKYDKFIDFCI
jgi:hypothetical protein